MGVTEAVNSDTAVSDNPFPKTQTLTAYRVKRSDDTDPVTGHPYMELWASGKMIARFVPEKPEHVGGFKEVSKSMHKPWGSLKKGEAIDLHPVVIITAPAGSGPRDDVRCVVRQGAFRDDIERKSDRRLRYGWACICHAETRHVNAYTDIIDKYITQPEDPDLDAALKAISDRAKEPDATTVIPNIEAATKISEEHDKAMATRNEGSAELDKYLDRESDQSTNPIDAVEKPTEPPFPHELDPDKALYALPAHLKKSMDESRVGPVIREVLGTDLKTYITKNTTRKAWDLILAWEVAQIPPTANVTVERRDAPVTPPAAVTVPPTVNDAPATRNEPQGGHVSAYPNYPESPVTVYPANNGSILYKGIRFNVSYRIGGNWTMAATLMDDFAAHREFIDPSCLMRQPMQNAATGGSVAPRDEDAPPMDDEPGDNEAGSTQEHGTAIARSFEGDKVVYTIWYNAGATETKFPLKVANQGAKLLETALRAAKYSPEKWETGKRYNSVHVNVTWTQGKEFAPGKHYRDWTKFEVVKEAESVPA